MLNGRVLCTSDAPYKDMGDCETNNMLLVGNKL